MDKNGLVFAGVRGNHSASEIDPLGVGGIESRWSVCSLTGCSHTSPSGVAIAQVSKEKGPFGPFQNQDVRRLAH